MRFLFFLWARLLGVPLGPMEMAEEGKGRGG